MAEDQTVSTTIEVPSTGAGHEGAAAGGVMDVSFKMVGLTWVTFLILTVILCKMAWKPILKALDLRESSIRKSLEDAEKARVEAAATEEKRKKMIQEAEAQTQKMLADARATAEQTTRDIEARARDEAKSLVDDAKREITAATEKARTELRKETADLAIALASKCIGKNMDSSANRTLVHELTKEL